MDYQTKTYDLSNVVSFLKTDEEYGGLSNMAAKRFPLIVNGIKIDNTEILYQICRFPNNADIQKIILNEKSPMGAKMKSKKYRKEYTRDDFELVKVDIMYWCLQIKLAFNPITFGRLLEKTGDMDIVEISHKDQFWGAKKDKDNERIVIGQNILGKLLMKLRTYYLESKSTTKILKVKPLEISNFLLLGNEILEVVNPVLLKL